MVDHVLDRALLLVEGRLELGEILTLRRGQLGLHARLEAGLGLGHELGAHVVPARVVGRGNGHGRVRELRSKNSRNL